ncbi:MAG: GtrA family protein [Actinomycetaceae bacterium]|nr:GtrA family protein [Actinomycetaceae bacterium]
MNKQLRSIFFYLFFGGTAFLLDFALLWFFVSIVDMPVWLGAALAFTAGALYSFLGQKILTFESSSAPGRELIRYIILLCGNLIFTVLVVAFFDSAFNQYPVGKIVTTALTTVWNYPLMRWWVYSHN